MFLRLLFFFHAKIGKSIPEILEELVLKFDNPTLCVL